MSTGTRHHPRMTLPAMMDPGHVELNHGDLLSDMAFGSVFIKHNLLPSRHRTNVSIETAQLLCAIQHDLNFDVRRIILGQILKVGSEKRGLLYFSCLITHFCRMAGIDATSDETVLQAPRYDIGKMAYNSYCTHHGLPNLPTEGWYRNRGRGAAAQNQPGARQGPAARVAWPTPPLGGGYPEVLPPWATQIRETVDEFDICHNRGHNSAACTMSVESRAIVPRDCDTVTVARHCHCRKALSRSWSEGIKSCRKLMFRFFSGLLEARP
ncbi:hypothetical protein L6452_01117 [Arctium lappa]|uniref:Uncharacterized protein n=1 Tax=Arctium lappa TaxID=4217 RepID=A0ACB9FFX0_ARCLA|nr:hypothetical protein L6452_01117 [Arctium lappa]